MRLSMVATLTICLSRTTASLFPMLASVNLPKRLPPSGDSVKLVSHSRGIALPGARVAHVAAR